MGFGAVSVGAVHVCGLRADATVTCWGLYGDSAAEPPDGAFAAVTAGRYESCALRADGAAVCWQRLPDGVHTAGAR